MPAKEEKPNITPSPTELLQYLEPYKVLICSSCQYAVQPDSIARHLKEIHHVHRDRKRPYTQYASTFQLADPAEVVDTPVIEFPVPLLPILKGLLCGYHGCRHLCASAKRMKSHQSLVHALIGQRSEDWYPIPMQTFFRGNLLAYFTDPRLGLTGAALGSHDKQRMATELRVSVMYRNGSNARFLDERDLFLLQHYTFSTSLTLATDRGAEDMWRNAIPQLAERFEFLMHGILACAALHLTHLESENRHKNMIKAIGHFDAALPLYRSAITDSKAESSDAILVFAHLLVINSFALQDESEMLLLAKTDAVDSFPSWLYFIRNGCSMLCDLWEPLSRGPVRSLLVDWESPTGVVAHHIEARWLDHLKSLIPPSHWPNAWAGRVSSLYNDAATSLAYAFACSGNENSAFTVWHVLRLWPVQLSEEFISLLSSSHPAALILVAHYCILLRQVETNWYFEGRATKLLDTIRRRLGEEWRSSIWLPVQEMGVSKT